MPGRDKKATTIDYIEPPQNKPAPNGNGSGSGSGNGTLNGTNGKTGYAPPSGGGVSRSVVSDAYYIKDFLSLDENLISMEDAKKEAEDLYNEYGFKTFIIRLPVIAKYLIKSEKDWLVNAAVKDLVARNNLSQKPALVIAMQLENNLDDSTFTYVLNWDKFNKLTTSSVNTRSVVSTLTDLEKESISGYVSGVYEDELDKKLNDSELTYTIRSLNSSLYAKQNLVYNPRTNFGTVNNVSDVRSIRVTLDFWNNKIGSNLYLIPKRFNIRLKKINDIKGTKEVKAQEIKNRWNNFLNDYIICDNSQNIKVNETIIKLYQGKNTILSWLKQDSIDAHFINNADLFDANSKIKKHGFTYTLNDFYDKLRIIYEELGGTQVDFDAGTVTTTIGEFKRFDSFLKTDSDLNKILNYINTELIKDGSFNLTKEDLKALAATESGDFTNKTIKGIIETDSSNVNLGIKDGKSSSSSEYIGICQIDTSEYGVASRWYKSHKTILGLTSNFPDKAYNLRENPRLSFVILAANYASLLEKEILNSKFFPLGITPKGIDMKSVLFAWYNASPPKAKAAFKAIKENNGFSKLSRDKQIQLIPQLLNWYGDSYISSTGLDIKNLSDFYNQKTNSRGEGWGETYRYIGRIRWRLKDDDIYTKDKIKKLFDSDEKQISTTQSCIQN